MMAYGYKFHLVKRNTLKIPRFICFGYHDTDKDIIETATNDYFSLNDYEVAHKEKLSFDPFEKLTNVHRSIQIMLCNGLSVEIVTDLWADWDFNKSGNPIKSTASPVNGNKNRTAVWRPCYEYFAKKDKKFNVDDGGTFEQWANAYLEAVHFYYNNKNNFFKNGFI